MCFRSEGVSFRPKKIWVDKDSRSNRVAAVVELQDTKA